MEFFSQYSGVMYFGNSLQSWMLAGLYLLVTALVFKVVLTVVLRYVERAAKETKTRFDDFLVDTLERVEWVFYLLASLFVVDVTLVIPEMADHWINNIYSLLLVLLGVRGVTSAIDYGAGIFAQRRSQGQDSVYVFAGFFKAAIWAIGFIFLLSLFGYNITSLVAGLGIGGIAIALAVQNILGDLFSSVSIYLDKPFVIGDFIQVGDKMGTVTKIGLKTTRVISMAGEELVIPNATLTGKEIQNFGRVKKRRGVINLGVTYDTSMAKMKSIPRIVEKIITSDETTEFDRGNFKEFGAFSKNYEFVFYVETKDYKVFLDRQQQILFDIQKAFEKEKIEFAFPSQTIYVKN